MNELEIIDKVMRGELASPYIGADCFYINLRITGLGLCRRVNESASVARLQHALKSDITDLNTLIALAYERQIQAQNFIEFEFIYRDAREFANLDLYNGMPITFLHPRKNDLNDFLNYVTIRNTPIIGVVAKPFEKQNQIWAVAKIFDLALLEALGSGFSTSPAILSSFDKMPQGLIEKPLFVNHLAIVKDGFWDFQNGKGVDFNLSLNSNKGEKMLEIVEPSKTAEEIEVKDDAQAVETKDGAQVEIKDDAQVENKDDAAQEIEVKDEAQEAEIKDEAEAEVKDEAQEVEIKDDAQIVEAKDDAPAEVVKVAVVKPQPAPSDIEGDLETADDRDRDAALVEIRKVSDEAQPLLNVRVPYFARRVNGAEAKRVFMQNNSQFVNSKYEGLISNQDATSRANVAKNRALIDEAFCETLQNIRKSLNEKKPVATQGSWIVTENPNVKINPNF